MYNFKKVGYSIPEVAQILGVTPATVRNRVNSGQMEALIDGVFEKGHKRKIRISRDQLASYIKKHEGYYERETVKTFMNSYNTKVKTASDAIDPDSSEAYTVSDISELSGAWSGIAKGLQNQKEIVEKEQNKQDVLCDSKTGMLLVDGRIMICNIEKHTIRKILDALLEDTKFNPKNITIKFE